MPTIFNIVNASRELSHGDLSWATAAEPKAEVAIPLGILTLRLTIEEVIQIILPVVLYWAYSFFFFVLSYFNFSKVNLHLNKNVKNKVTTEIIILNVLLQQAIQIILNVILVKLNEMQAHEPTYTRDTPLIVVIKLAASIFLFDTYQYWMHRAMHLNLFLYKWVHSVHHQIVQPYAFSALYNSPIEAFLVDTVGGAIPAVLFNLDPWTLCAFACVATLKTVDDHCGMAVPFSPFQLLFRNNSEFHGIHHYGLGRKYNFSQPFFTFWDIWMGTDFELHCKESTKKLISKSEKKTD